MEISPMIKRILMLLLLPLSLPVLAQGATAASIDRMLVAMHAQSMIESTYTMMQAMMKRSLAQAMPGEPTPAGQAYVAKMPTLTRKSMEMMQERMQALRPRMMEAVEKAVRDAKATEPR
jgi:hypothetical protein